MFCTECGQKVDDGELFCTNCGAPLDQATENLSQQSQTTELPSASAVNEQPTEVLPSAAPSFSPANTATMPVVPEQPKKGKKAEIVLWIVAAVFFTIAIVIAVVFFVLPQFQNQDQSRQQTTEEVVESQEEGSGDTSNPELSVKIDSYSNADRQSSDVGGYNYSASSSFILPASDTQFYSTAELEQLSDYELYLARNEIYARHGRIFNNEDLRQYFNAQDWYYEVYAPEEFDSLVALNEYEKQNANTILALEKSRNSSYVK